MAQSVAVRSRVVTGRRSWPVRSFSGRTVPDDALVFSGRGMDELRDVGPLRNAQGRQGPEEGRGLVAEPHREGELVSDGVDAPSGRMRSAVRASVSWTAATCAPRRTRSSAPDLMARSRSAGSQSRARWTVSAARSWGSMVRGWTTDQGLGAICGASCGPGFAARELGTGAGRSMRDLPVHARPGVDRHPPYTRPRHVRAAELWITSAAAATSPCTRSAISTWSTKICGEHVFDGKPTRTAGAKR